MRIRFWGTRGTRPTPGPSTLRYGGNTACVEVRARSGGVVILDSGSGIAELGDALIEEGRRDATILVTHTHWDHIQGFPYFAPAFEPGSKIRIMGPRGSIKPLEEAFVDQMDPAYFPLRLDQMPARVEFVEVSAERPFELDGMRVVPHLLNHPIVTFGYRLEADGRSLVYATDNELLALDQELELRAWVESTDLLIHDAQYGSAELIGHVGWGHSSLDGALALARATGVARLAFFHHDPRHSDEDIDSLVADALAPGGRELEAFAAAEVGEVRL
ncbi:MAG TPA: MBL fold metallo-hydrolase [Candidatus Nitrosotalea sp.]|nr:MBL fold metallo-hydrolase [Candidatus Nitrosotalea sp.]